MLLAAIVFGTFGWKVFYRAPSCFDGAKNGNETGIDCGGSCVKLCPEAFTPPINSWTRFEEVVPGIYNVAAYIINPNTDGEAFGVPYHVDVYDKKGMLISAYNGTFTLAPNRNSLAFYPSLNLGQSLPQRAVFQITGIPNWHATKDPLAKIAVIDKAYSESNAGSALSVTLKNSGVESIGRFSVYAVLYDKNSNVIGFSKTVIDGMAFGEIKIAPFTWGAKHSGLVSIEVLPVAE